mgnify:CR=1 FL=1
MVKHYMAGIILVIVLAAFSRSGAVWSIASLLAAVPASVGSYCLLAAALKAVVLRQMEPGIHKVESAP